MKQIVYDHMNEINKIIEDIENIEGVYLLRDYINKLYKLLK